MTDLTREEMEIIRPVMPEAAMVPENMPKMEEIEKWEGLLEKKFVKMDPKGNILSPGVHFEPTNLFPSHDVKKNRVDYRFHVRVLFGNEIDKRTGKATPYPRVIGDKLIDVDKFMKDYKPV